MYNTQPISLCRIFRSRQLWLVLLLTAMFSLAASLPRPAQAHSGDHITVPIVDSPPRFDGACNSYEAASFGHALQVPIDSSVRVLAERTATDLYLCFVGIDNRGLDASGNYPPPDSNDAAVVYIDRDHTGSAAPRAADYRFSISPTSATTVRASTASGGLLCVPLCISQWGGPDPGGWSASGRDSAGEFTVSWSAELRISVATLGGTWNRTTGLMLSYEHGSDSAVGWPSTASDPKPNTWGDMDFNQSELRYPRYNQVYGIATHNSYWINRSDQVDYFSSGTQELLSDQLLHDHVRALELDVHSEDAPAHEWKIYHTSDSEDFSCRLLSDCLELLRNFQYAVPQHEVINVIVELKNTVPNTGASFFGIPTHFNFTADHTVDDFDGIFRRMLGNALYTPRDFLSRCASNSTMVDCAKAAGWPTIDELRGKFIINIHGNWSTAAYDWAQYASRDMHNRLAFPIQTVYELYQQPCNDVVGGYNPPAPVRFTATTNEGTYCIKDVDDRVDPAPYFEPSQRQAAFAASVFWQLEDTNEPALAAATRFLEDNGVIRGRDSYDYGDGCQAEPDNCQEQRIRAGFQMIQTDYPWHVVNDGAPGLDIPTDPSQRFKDPSTIPGSGNSISAPTPLAGAAFHEPGTRIYFHTAPSSSGVWAYTSVPAVAERWWETTVSTTRHGDTFGERTHDGLILDDYIQTCPAPGQGQALCTNYPRRAQEAGQGCIKVSSDSGASGMEICRQKNTTPGASYYQEGVDIYARVYRHGQQVMDKEYEAARYGPCKQPNDPNSDNVANICVGSLIGLAVDNQGTQSVVTVYSAGKLRCCGSNVPDWQVLDTETFAEPMTKQGLAASQDVLFAGARVRDGDTALRPITLCDLSAVETNGGSMPTIVDLSYPKPSGQGCTPATSGRWKVYLPMVLW